MSAEAYQKIASLYLKRMFPLACFSVNFYAFTERKKNTVWFSSIINRTIFYFLAYKSKVVLWNHCIVIIFENRVKI